VCRGTFYVLTITNMTTVCNFDVNAQNLSVKKCASDIKFGNGTLNSVRTAS
jgi:hypothetical protein